MAGFFGDVLDNIGTALNLPEFGLSESANMGGSVNTGRVSGGGSLLPGYSTEITQGDHRVKFNLPNGSLLSNGASGSWGAPVKNPAVNPVGGAGNDAYDPYGIYSGGGASGGGSAPAYSARDEQVAYDDQISAIERLLGYTNTQKQAGLTTMQERAAAEKRKLDAQKARAMADYEAQSVESSQDKQRGISTVDSYANDSYRNLMRVLQGGNAGSSSVARELIPQLVSKSAGQRRQGVFDTAGKNDQMITSARDDAEVQYGENAEELENNRKAQEQSFLETIYGKQNELSGSLRDLQIKRGMATGQGYAQARAAGDAAQSSINERQNQLASLFGQYKPTFAAKSINAKRPDLAKFTVDRAQLDSQQGGLPAESSYYLSQLKKKQELGL